MWLTLTEWSKEHRVSPRSVLRMIEEGIIGDEDYFKVGKTWRIRAELEFKNKRQIRLVPCKEFLKEVEAV